MPFCLLACVHCTLHLFAVDDGVLSGRTDDAEVFISLYLTLLRLINRNRETLRFTVRCTFIFTSFLFYMWTWRIRIFFLLLLLYASITKLCITMFSMNQRTDKTHTNTAHQITIITITVLNELEHSTYIVMNKWK